MLSGPFEIDPDLRDRRLATLVRMLEEGQLAKDAQYDLTPAEMGEWAHQCRNILGTATPAPRRNAKRKEVDPLLR